MEDSNKNKTVGVIPVHWFKGDQEKPNPVKLHDFQAYFEITATKLRAMLNIANKPNCRLSYVPNDEAKVIAEIEILEPAVVTLNEVKNFVVRLEEERASEQNTEPSDSSTVKQTDCDEEGITRTTLNLKKVTPLPSTLKPLQEILLCPISIPNTERFDTLCQDLLPPTGMPKGTVPLTILVPSPINPSINLTLDLIGSETMYEDYWILVLKIRNQIEKHFLSKNKRTEAQWQSSVYQPLFEATSLQGLTTGLNPFCVHSKITRDAFATSKFRSFANGPHALKPDVADGWLVMKDESEAAFVYDIVKLNQEPFTGLEAKFGDCSHLLLDLVVELKKDQDDTSDMIKVIAALGIISSVLQYVTQMNHLLTFGFTVHKEYIVFYVMHPLECLPLKFKQESKYKQDKKVEEQSKAEALKEDNTIADRTRSKGSSKEAAEDKPDGAEYSNNNQKIENNNDQKAEDTAPKPRLEATQLFSWSLVNETQYFEFAIFLYRLYRLRLLQQCMFKIAFDQQHYKPRDEVKQTNNNTTSTKPANKSQSSAQGHKSSDSHGEVPEGAKSGDAMDVEHSPDFVDEQEACSNPKLLKCIFKHSTGNVHLASSESHQQLIIKQFYTNSLKLLANERQVYKMLKGLSCIPKVISVSTEHSLGLEYIKGQHYCKVQTLDDVLQYMIMLLKALHDIHSRGVVHSDIKFANVIYEPQQPLMKVIDFSYSTIAEQYSLVPCTGYTERYAAPEVHEWNKVGFASDVFSAGMMFTALLYGTKVGEEDYQFFRRLVNQVENRFRCTEASEIAKAMIAKDWENRITVSEAIEKILKLQPSLAAFIN